MPPRRQRNVPSATALPPRRLPLGTPHLPPSPSLSHATPSILESPPPLRTQPSDLSFDHDLAWAPEKERCPSGSSAKMLSTGSTPDVSTKSIAEAKLERQRKRIEEAEASLTAPAPLDRRAQGSRGGNCKWKPLDHSTDTTASRAPGDGDIPVSEVRINTFRAPSRAQSITRSVSVLSHRTSDTHNSDVGRRDSTLLDDAGFQVYKSRKQKKFAGDVNAWEDRPEQRQTTVEATFDTREIYDVFGNALPGRDFIDENPGASNGQLQFVQHPNGDVSAHQWSADRYIWENIGQFSNIRKKVEGQLAADHLKGETAYQTLQQNTLAYFRIIAKQREAHVMGVPFGLKEIQAAIPEPSHPLAAAPTGLKEALKDSQISLSAPSKIDGAHENLQDFSTTGRDHASMRGNLSQQRSQTWRHNTRPVFPNITQNTNLQSYRHDDPFYSHAHYSSIYGPQSGTQQHFPPMAPAARPYYATPPRHSGLNYGFHFPTALQAAYAPQSGPCPQYNQIKSFTSRFQPVYGTQNSNIGQHGCSQYRPPTDHQPLHTTPSHGMTQAVKVSNDTSTPQSHRTINFNPRTAARDQLWKLPEAAKERSQSQTNIRTVLFDPFRNQQTPAKAEQDDPKKEDPTPTFTKHVSGNTLQPPASFDHSVSKFFPTALAPQLQKPPSPANSNITNDLLNSSPDPPQKISYVQTTPIVKKPIAMEGTKQTLQPPFFPDELRLNPAISSLSTEDQQTHDERLQEWWTSGNKFARQEEFYQSLVNAPPTRTTSTTQSSPLSPIAPPSSKPPETSDHTARLLIPLLENLQSYISGPASQRRDYFCQWTKAPDWCIDSSATGNSSFHDKDWGTPPQRVGRDPRYAGMGGSWSASRQTPVVQRGRLSSGGTVMGMGLGSPAAHALSMPMAGLDRRFVFGGRY